MNCKTALKSGNYRKICSGSVPLSLKLPTCPLPRQLKNENPEIIRSGPVPTSLTEYFISQSNLGSWRESWEWGECVCQEKNPKETQTAASPFWYKSPQFNFLRSECGVEGKNHSRALRTENS